MMILFFAPTPSDPRHQVPSIAPAQGIRTSQIICVSLIMGSVAFLIVTLIIPGQPKPPVIAYIAVAFAVIEILLRLIIPTLSANSQIQKLPPNIQNIDERLFPIFQSKMIVGLALLQGACFFNLVAYMIERQWWSLAIVGVLTFLMMSMFPTLGQFESWAETVKRDRQNQF